MGVVIKLNHPIDGEDAITELLAEPQGFDSVFLSPGLQRGLSAHVGSSSSTTHLISLSFI